tara:strand:+ start:387 stop:608 length:222 start_codon:yes stop_codon:yes gene_type:complete
MTIGVRQKYTYHIFVEHHIVIVTASVVHVEEYVGKDTVHVVYPTLRIVIPSCVVSAVGCIGKTVSRAMTKTVL